MSNQPKTIAEIRAELLKEQARASGSGNRSFGPSAIYPFWNAPNNTTTVVRFLPDSDASRIYFWRERQIISIPFATVEGHPELTNVVVEVPCVKMYNKKNVCPIIQDTRALWGTNEESIARMYYPKKSFLYQGFVVSSELEESEVPENPIRRFIVGNSIHKIIESSLVDPEMDATPVDAEFGLDFRIVKNKQGTGYADYSTSSFARRSRPLGTTELEAVEEHGLFDLGEFLPREPDAEMMDVIVAMYNESRYGSGEYKLDWSKFYNPKGQKLNTQAQPAPQQPAQSSSSTDDDAPFDTTAQAAPQQAQASASPSDDIMAQIRNRINGG